MKDQRKTKAQLIEELEALRQSEERYWQIFESANDAIISLTLDGIITTVNRGAEVLLGWPREERVGRHYREFLTPPSVTFTEERARRIQAGEKVSSIYEIELLRKDGSVVPVEARSRFIRDREGKPIGILTIHRDITARKRVEEALRASEEKYRAIFNASPDFIYLTDTEGYILDANPTLLDRTGLSLEQLRQRHFMDFFAGENRQEVEQAFEKLKSGQPIHKLEVQARNALGEYFEYEVNAAPLLKEGVPNSTLSLARDITERKRAEEALRQAEQKYHTLVDRIHEGVFIIQDRKVQFANDAFASMVGYTVDEVTGIDFRELVAPEDVEMVADRYHRRQAGEEVPWAYEFRMLHGDKRTRVIVDMNTTLITYQGKVASMGTVRDITARKRAEAALQESEQRYRTISELISDYAYAARLEPDGAYALEWITEAFTRITGFTLNQEVYSNDDWTGVIHPEDMPIVRERLQRLMAGRTDVSEFRIITKSGEVRWLREYGHPVWDEVQGRVVRLYIAGHDITDHRQAEEERQKLQEQLFQAQKLEALGTLAGGVAHDFDNILSAIMGFTELATDDVPEGTGARRNLEEVLKASRRAKALVQQILTFSRPSQKKCEPIQLHPIIEETLTFLRASLRETIEIHHHLDKTAGPVAISSTQLQQVLTNLCGNAIQALGERGGVLEVSLQQIDAGSDLVRTQKNLKPGPYIRLTVSDTGCGMTPEVLERIFEPFFTTRPVGEGNGLGLSIVHGIVTGQGGTITVESTPGKGTMLHVYLPVSEESVGSENAFHPLSSSAEGSPGDEKGALNYATHSGH